MKKLLKIVAALVVLLVVAAGAGLAWASGAAADKLAAKVTSHDVDFPIPFPLTEDEMTALRAERGAAAQQAASEGEGGADAAADPLAGVDLAALALERAVERGKHLVNARYACSICHGADFGGGVMVEDPMLGTLKGPNLTTGKGSRTVDYKTADWDRIVRHGIKPDGTPAVMPADDFFGMSDRELSDIIAYIRSVPSVDREQPAPTFGPLGKVLLATGKMPLAATKLSDHQAVHIVDPPVAGETVVFGKHLAQVCTGCHRHDLNGGPIAAGPPDWPPASNLTPDESGLKGWTYEQFLTLMKEGKRPDGTAVKVPMSEMPAMAAHMKEVELKALWTYLSSLEPKPKGQ